MTAPGPLYLRQPCAKEVTECGVCGSGRLDMVLSLGSAPPPCVMHPIGRRPLVEEHYPLELLRCADCTLVQLSVVVDPEVVFPPDYPYSSGNSNQLHRNFEELAEWVSSQLDPLDLIVDIGANDGTLLRKFHNYPRRVGIEPTDQATQIEGDYYQAFFSEEVAAQVLRIHGGAKVVTACNVLAHVADLNNVMRGVRLLLDDDGIFVAENHDLYAVMQGQWDMVYHEHLRYFDLYSFACLMSEYGLQVVSWERTQTHGGSFRMIARKGDYMKGEFPRMGDYDFEHLRQHAVNVRDDIRRDLNEHPHRFVAIGATARGSTILNYCGLDVDDVECVLEVPTSDKIGRYMPGTAIPVVDESRLFEPDVPRAMLLSWHMEDIIVPKLRARGYHGPILVPLPTPHYV